MLSFLFWRLLQSVGVLWVVYTLTFVLLMLAPGDPFIGEKKPPPSVREAIAKRYGLEFLAYSPEKRAAMSQRQKLAAVTGAYVLYGGNLLRFDLGPTLAYENWTVNDVIKSSLPVSVALGSFALLIALWLGVIAGTVGAVFKGKWPDMGLTVMTLFGVSLPTFVTGSLLIMLFAVYWPVLPSGGWGRVSQLILPATTLALFFMAYIARLTRVSVLDVISADFIRTARAKGLSPTRVVTHHVLRNATLPVLSYIGPAAATVLTGSFVVERLFAIPGLGTHFIAACLYPDLPLVLGAVMVYTALVVAFNLLVDIAYAFVDPRIRL